MILARCLKEQKERSNAEIQTTSGARTIERGGFGLHLALGEVGRNLHGFVEANNHTAVWQGLRRYFELASGLDVEDCGSFLVFARNLVVLRDLNSLSSVPPFMGALVEERKNHKTPPWDYPGRGALMLVHLIGRVYGWSIETIFALEPEMGFVLVNEILVDEQLNQEWEYGLSEVSRVYNEATKKTHFKPLPRPSWMVQKVSSLVTKLPKNMLPVGNVVDLWENGNARTRLRKSA